MILVAGLTPAWQQVLRFDRFTRGIVNRAAEAEWCASGKVLNVARALRHLGAAAVALAPAGGASGTAIRADCERLGLEARWIPVTEPTRICTTIIDAARREVTELVENARELAEQEIAAFRSAYAEEACSAEVAILIGSLPPGTPVGIFRELMNQTTGRTIVDARGPELVEALAARPFLVKPNKEELARTLGKDLRNDRDVLDAMKNVVGMGATWVIVTDGAKPVLAASAKQCYELRAPPRDVVNPIGCGDCMAAGIAWALAKNCDPIEAIRLGVATAASKVTRHLPGVVELSEVGNLRGSIEVVQR